MVDAIIDSLSGLSAGWIVFIISMLPIAELRVGIPLGIALGLPGWQSFLFSVLGNGLIAIPVLLLLPKIFELLQRVPAFGKYIDKIVRRAQHKAQGLNKKSFLGLMIFVGIPLPGTGVWTGCLIAYLLGMRIRYALASVILGMLLAGVLMTLSSLGVVGLVRAVNGIEYVLGAILLCGVAYYIYRRSRKKKTEDQ